MNIDCHAHYTSTAPEPREWCHPSAAVAAWILPSGPTSAFQILWLGMGIDSAD